MHGAPRMHLRSCLPPQKTYTNKYTHFHQLGPHAVACRWLEVTASAVREQQGRRRVSCGAAGLGKNDGAQPAPRAAYSFGGVRRNVPQVEQLPTCREAPGL